MSKTNIEHRKIQQFGEGSYVISLPKDWVKKVKLEKGSELELRLNRDLSLLLTPSRVNEKKNADSIESKKYSIYIDEEKDPQSLCRKITALYAIGSNFIHLHFKDTTTFEALRKTIRSFVKRNLLGSEIIDEKPNEIFIRTLITSDQFPLEQAIRRMGVLLLDAIKDIVEVLKSMNEDLIIDTLEVQNEVNRLNLYVVRQLKFGIEQNAYEDFGFKTPKEFLGYRVVANDIRRISDGAMNVAERLETIRKMIKNQTLLLNETIDDEIYSQITKLNSMASILFEDSLTALFRRDYKNADKVISNADSFTAYESDLAALVFSKKLDPNVSSILSLVLYILRQIIECSRSIAEVALHRSIGEAI